MRLYIDLSCFNRPFDDQGQERIRLETEAVLSVLTRVLEGRDLLLWSWAMSYENDKHPKRIGATRSPFGRKFRNALSLWAVMFKTEPVKLRDWASLLWTRPISLRRK